MNPEPTTPRYTLGYAQPPDAFDAALALRTRCFGPAGGAVDDFDAAARHLCVYDRKTGATIATCRLTSLRGAAVLRGYTAQFYDLNPLAALDQPMIELGRFCIHPDWHDPDILRLIWAGLTAQVDGQGAMMLFGCTSFHGCDPAPFTQAFALLAARYLAPLDWRPVARSQAVVRFADQPPLTDPKQAAAALPSLLRTYLLMGGGVSDHAVIDREMGTLHVFTALEIAAIPPGRQRLLRALVGD